MLAARGGWTRDETEALIDELGLREAVAVHFAAPDELPELCASADVGVSIASTDATPASMVESMLSGLPMVMGDAVTIDEWITQGEGGEVVPCRDENAVADALLRLLRDAGLRRRTASETSGMPASAWATPGSSSRRSTRGCSADEDMSHRRDPVVRCARPPPRFERSEIERADV